jgi:alkylated DNA nucleotide flippase Atl1
MVAIVEWNEPKDPSPDFVDRVLAIVNAIPPGRVMTYGDIAAEVNAHPDLAGTTGSYGARMVGFVMSRFGSAVPWWRVIRSTGQPPKFHEERAWPFYVEEGTPLTGPRERYRIELKRARYQPHADSGDQAPLDLF